MKKKAAAASQSISALIPPETGTCTYGCFVGLWLLSEDNSQPGYECPPELGDCETTGEFMEVDAYPIGGGGGEGVTASSAMAAPIALPKNSALYQYHPDRKTFRRLRGAWAIGHFTPLEMTLKELAKFAPKVFKLVNPKTKSRAVISFQVIVPSQTLPSKGKTSSKVASKKPSPKTIASAPTKKKETPKKKA